MNSLLAVGLVQLWRDLRHPLVWLIGLGAIAKIFLEISSEQALLTQTAWPSVPEVHAVGFLSGLVIVIAMISHISRKTRLASGAKHPESVFHGFKINGSKAAL